VWFGAQVAKLQSKRLGQRINKTLLPPRTLIRGGYEERIGVAAPMTQIEAASHDAGHITSASHLRLHDT
jgi:hypothetical protein